ncbi:MAG: hypothetical protein IT209_00900 [Armatimonadetes bacterium]|nr:hypothetical protein [Armatimonadota bacterium]
MNQASLKMVTVAGLRGLLTEGVRGARTVAVTLFEAGRKPLPQTRLHANSEPHSRLRLTVSSADATNDFLIPAL